MVKSFEIPIFGGRVKFCFCTYNVISKLYGEEFTYAEGAVAGIQEDAGGYYYLVWINEDQYNINVIAHEATHLAYYVLADIGQEHDVDGHEVLAYLVGYFTEEFAKIIDKKRKKK